MEMRKKQGSLKTNFIMNSFLTMSSFIFPLISFPYVSRILLPTGPGKVQFATSFIAYFTMIAQLGIPTYGIRACSKVRDDRKQLSRTAHELLTISFVMSLIMYVVLAIALFTIPRLQSDRWLFGVVSISILLSSLGMEWLYKGLEKYSYITIRSVAFKFIALILMFIFVHEQKDYIIYGAISIFAASASNVMNLMNSRKYIDFKWLGEYHLKKHLKSIGIFFAMTCATTVYTNLDVIMIGFINNDDEVGYYNAAIKIKYVLVSIVTSLGAVILPRASYYIEKGNIVEFEKLKKLAIDFVCVISIPLSVFFIVFAQNGIVLLSGDLYTPAVMPMRIIMPTLVLIGVTNILGMQILVPTGREKIVLFSVVTGAVIDLVLNAVLIPLFASSGAAIGTLCAELVVLFVQVKYLKEEFWKMIKSVKMLLIIFATAIASLGSFWIIFFSLPDLLVLIIATIMFFSVYFGILLLCRENFMIYVKRTIITRWFKNN